MLLVIVVLKGEPSPQSKVACTLEQVLQRPPCIWLQSFILQFLPLQYEAATTMLHHRDGFSQMMSSGWCLQDIVFGLLLEEFKFASENVFAHALRVL